MACWRCPKSPRPRRATSAGSPGPAAGNPASAPRASPGEGLEGVGELRAGVVEQAPLLLEPLVGLGHLGLGAHAQFLLGIELDPQRLEVGGRALPLSAQLGDGALGRAGRRSAAATRARPRPGAGRGDEPGERGAGHGADQGGESEVHAPEGSPGPLHLSRGSARLAAPCRERVAISRTRARRLRRAAAPDALHPLPRACGVDRSRGERGFCGAGSAPRVASFALHRGEEPPISGDAAPGTSFSRDATWPAVSARTTRSAGSASAATSAPGSSRKACSARAPRRPQRQLRHPDTLGAADPRVPAARATAGLALPVVWNCGGYESLPALRLLDGVVDVWLPDMKYADGRRAWALSRAPRYPAANRRAVAEMVRQAGPLQVGADGLARRGVLVRHLVVPGGLADTRAVLAALRQIDPRVPVSLMYQYFPAHRASATRSTAAASGARRRSPPGARSRGSASRRVGCRLPPDFPPAA